MRRWLVISVALLATSCVMDHGADEMQQWKQLTCACHSVACAEVMMKLIPPTKSTHRTQGIAREMLECVAKLYAAERPSTNPDAP